MTTASPLKQLFLQPYPRPVMGEADLMILELAVGSFFQDIRELLLASVEMAGL